MALTGNDKTYADIMASVQNAKDQNSINAARNRLGELQGIGAGDATSTFSSILDKAQQGLAPKTPVAYDPTNDINSLKEMQKQQALAGLSSARDSALSNLNTERAGVEPQYYTKRNDASITNQLQAKNFAEFMANRNLTNTGTSAQADISNNVALQGQLGALGTQEQATYDDINKRVTDTNNNYSNQVAQSNAQIEANAVQQLIAAKQKAYEDSLNQFNTDRQYNFNENQANQQQTMQQAQFDYQKQQDDINNTYRQGTFEWQQAMDKANQDFQVKQAQITQNNWQQTFDYNKSQDAINNNLKVQAAKNSSSSTAKTPSVSQQNADAKANAQKLTGDIQTYLDSWASGKADGQSGRAGQSDMLNYLKANSGILTQQGVDVNALATWVKNNYTWDKVNGEWKNLSD